MGLFSKKCKICNDKHKTVEEICEQCYQDFESLRKESFSEQIKKELAEYHNNPNKDPNSYAYKFENNLSAKPRNDFDEYQKIIDVYEKVTEPYDPVEEEIKKTTSGKKPRKIGSVDNVTSQTGFPSQSKHSARWDHNEKVDSDRSEDKVPDRGQ